MPTSLYYEERAGEADTPCEPCVAKSIKHLEITEKRHNFGNDGP
ncbi:hypothetical protein [Roseibium sediminicola]|nr:hypothetical protein [Roseibium sp. CAU 1639]